MRRIKKKHKLRLHLSLWLFITSIILPWHVLTQPITEMYSQVQKNSLLDAEKIHLHLPGGDVTFNAFIQKLEKLSLGKVGKINVVHIGGSHVQGGTLPNTIRNNLVHLHPQFFGERGLLFPYKMAGTNNPADFKTTFSGEWHGHRSSVSSHYAEFGICGITATTYDPEATFSIQLYPLNGREYYYDRVRIYHPFGPEYMKPVWTGQEDVVITWENPTIGYTEFVLENATTTNQFALRSYVDSAQKFVLQGIQFFLDKPSLVYHAIGVNGANTSSYLREPEFARQVRLLRADVVIFGIGINDANVPFGKFDKEQFKSNYEKLMDVFGKGNRDVFFVFLTNTDSYYQKKHPNKNALLAREAVFELALKHKAGVIDVFEIMGGLGSSTRWRQSGMMSADLVHFTPKGYELLGHAISAAIIDAVANHLHRSTSFNVLKNVELVH
ncbi:MAG: GDSL-type esterase/lipase family protein [Thermaurantimonas sp.]|uniref:GDSL-type esterase/lipase family protein n=1 Tax=Thermaurantimonas sp. TaxID=2681568 RepID=UPI003918F8AE